MPRRQQEYLTYTQYLQRIRHCRCGCGETVTGKKIFFNAACRQRIKRLKDRLESKRKPKAFRGQL